MILSGTRKIYFSLYHFWYQSLALFWLRYPALFYSLIVYLATLFALSYHQALFIPLCVLTLSAGKERGFLGAALFIGAYFFASTAIQMPPDTTKEVTGKARLQITDIAVDSRYGRSYYKLKADIKELVPDDGGFLVANLPCQIAYAGKSSRPRAGCLYAVTGTLKNNEGVWSFKVAQNSSPNSLWKVESSTLSLAEWRYRAKNAAKCFFATHFDPGYVRSFLEGVCIGEFHDMELQAQLKRFGLQHILVVSGFHFSLIGAILAGLLRLVFPRNVTVGLLTVCITGYLIFVGMSPSVLRAYIAIQLALWAKLCEKKSSGLNALGVGLLAICLYDPVMLLSPSFQLSFLATWAILLLYPIIEKLLFSLFPRYQGEDVLAFSFTEQLLFLLATFFLTSLSLVCAVSVLMLPMSLFIFHSFPLLGMLYNCFFPFLVSIAVTLLVLGLLFCWISPLASFFFFLSATLTEMALTLVQHAPLWVDATLYWDGLTATALVAYIVFVSVCAIAYKPEKAL